MMFRWSALPRSFLATVAVIFAFVASLYGSVWMYDVRLPNTQVELGFNHQHNEPYSEKTHSILIDDVVKDSPAEKGGMRAGDRIVGVNGRMLTTSAPYDEAYLMGRPGDPVEFIIERPGEIGPVDLHGIFRASTRVQGQEGLAKSFAQQILRLFPVLFLLVGFAVLFLRLDDPTAWMLALMFCAFAAAPDISNPLALSPLARALAYAYRAIFNGMLASFFYLFFAMFPVRSPLERWLPWLKWVGLALGGAMAWPALSTGVPNFPQGVANLAGDRGSLILLLTARYGLLALGMVSLAQNSFLAAVPAEARRKSRVILWGTIAGVLPILVERAAKDFGGFQASFWLDTGVVLILFLYPLSFVYAVVKHRVMEIPVLLRRSARYVLVQRGFTVLLFVAAVCTITFFTRTFSRFFQTDTNIGMMLSAAFGIALVWAAAPLVRRGTGRIDRAFFRSAYDARVILQDLAEKTRGVTCRADLAALLEHHLNKALHPKTFVCYFGTVESELIGKSGNAPAGAESLPSDLPILIQLAARGKAWEVPSPDSGEADVLPQLAPLAPECLVPILNHEGRLSGLLVLGQRLSEEPYSNEDKRLLDSVASQAGIALENIHLAEQMAERMEADRRVARDMEIAREVQSRLFPQVMPPLATLEYAGTCIQARVVGGDYYDFLDLGPGRLGIVLADISGKGIAAALLMANLQANLRSQHTVALEDPHRLLQSANHLFYENTPEDRSCCEPAGNSNGCGLRRQS
jgi:sigma-B regulation protein RsbU (phosphoserine phosphatase)